MMFVLSEEVEVEKRKGTLRELEDDHFAGRKSGKLEREEGR
jgi:hypothetical protein